MNGSVTSNTTYVLDPESAYNDIIMAKESVTGKNSLFTFSDEVISVETSGNISYYRTDEKHSVTDIIDETGKVQATIEYDEYGVIKKPEVVSTSGNIFAYTGHVYEESTGLYYAKARYYDAEIGRFVSEDSYKGEKGEILSHNLYIYGYNNPNRYLDFSGHNVKDFIRGMADTLDDNNFFGFVKWIFKKALGKGKYQWKNELHYYGGRIVGDVISMIHGFWQFCKSVTKIVGSLIGGGAITVGSGGTLSVGGVSVAVAGVAAGTVEVTYSGKVITKSASSFSSDVKRFAELSRGKTNSSKLSNQQLNEAQKKVLSNKDVKFNTKEQALDFIEKKFPDFKKEIAGQRSSHGWHFDRHSINGSKNPIDHINIYSKKFKFRIHITWGN
jgi:RHS repeat-associated protein